MAGRLGRWQQLLVDALTEHPTVSVQAVVEQHLGRRADRSERHAAHRAAHLLARRGGAVIEHVKVPAGSGRSRLAVTRPDDWPAGMGHEATPPSQPPVVRWLPDSAPAVAAAPRFGRWQQVIMDALEQYEVAGLQVVVEGHLGRRGKRAETTAARRAAHLLAQSGQVRLARVRVPAARGRPSRELLTISQTGADPATLTEAALQHAAVRRVAAADRTSDALSDIAAAVDQAAAQLPAVDMHTVDAGTADRVARSLARPLRQLTQLRQELLHRRPPA